MNRQRRILPWICAALVAVSACGDTTPPGTEDDSNREPASASSADPDENTGPTAPSSADPIAHPVAEGPVSADPIAHPVAEAPVSVEWLDDVDRTLFLTAHALKAEVRNHTASRLKVNVAAVGEGMNEAYASYVAELELDAGEAREIELALDSVPVQMTNAAAPVRLMAVLPELEQQVPSRDLSISFNERFDLAFVSQRSALGPTLAATLHGEVQHPRIVEMLADASAPIAADEIRSDEMLTVSGRVLKDESFVSLESLPRVNELVTFGAAMVSPPSAQHFAPQSGGLTLGKTGLAPVIITPFPAFVYVHLCARWSETFSDSSPFGEDELNEGTFRRVGTGTRTFFIFVYDPIPARFASATVRDPVAGTTVYNGPLDAQGCVDLSVWPGRYELAVTSLLVKNGLSYDIRWLYPKGIDYTCPDSLVRDDPITPRLEFRECEANGRWVREFSVARPLNRWDTVNVNVDSGYALDFGRVAAVAGLMLAKDDGAMVPNKPYLAYSNSGCSSFNWREACANSIAYFGLSFGQNATDTTLEKFTIAHELGHQLEWQRGATKYFDYPPRDANNRVSWAGAGVPALCGCDHVIQHNNWHCLQSRHDYSTAHTEGFAQFVSARTMNEDAGSDCSFAYYKDVLFPDGTLTAPPVRVDCSTPQRWTATYCPLAGTSSEWDLMEFYRGLTTGSPDALTLAELLAVLAGADHGLTSTSFRTSAARVLGAGSAKYARLVSLQSTYGVQL